VWPALLFGQHLAKPAAELNTTRGAHNRKPYPVVPQFLQDRASFSRTQVKIVSFMLLR